MSTRDFLIRHDAWMMEWNCGKDVGVEMMAAGCWRMADGG